MPKYLDTQANIYTAMQVSRTFGNYLEYVDGFIDGNASFQIV